MSRHILLSPIGRSPGAVTGIYYALQEEGVEIDAVALLATAMEKVRQSARIVQDELGHDRVVLLPLRTPNQEAYTVDFDNEDAAVDFIRLANAVLVEARDRGDRVSLGISGGRSSMGALAALSAYVYGAEGIYHLWVHEDVEKQGDVDDLPVFDRDRYLNPPKELRRLVRLQMESFDDQLQPEKIVDFASRHPTLTRAVTDLDMGEYQELKVDFKAGRMGVPRDLYRALRTTLLDCCSALGSDQDLRAAFVTSPLQVWQHEVPEASSPAKRADRLIDFLWNRQDGGGEPALIPFLSVMVDRVSAGTACAQNLMELQERFQDRLPPSDVPTLDYEEVASKLQAIFKGSELAPVLDEAIELARLSGEASDPEAVLALAERLKPHFKPDLWEQVQRDLRDWNSWKAAADRLLRFVEAVGEPLAVAGIAAMLGITLS